MRGTSAAASESFGGGQYFFAYAIYFRKRTAGTAEGDSGTFMRRVRRSSEDET